MSHSNRATRKRIAQETLKIQEELGHYTINGNNVDITSYVLDCINGSRVYTATELKELGHTKPKPVCAETRIEVTRELAIAASRRLAEEYTNVTCLNFASAKNVCGGMLGGSLAQEESIGLCSTLYLSQSQFQEEYYAINRRDPKQGLYNNTIIFSPKCAVFRDDTSLALLESPCSINFISSCAVNFGVFQSHGGVASVAKALMRERIENVLNVAMNEGTEALVLGAWGCGVFKNDPRDIARYFAEALDRRGAKFKNVFKHVVFAIGPDDKNFIPFEAAFEIS